MALEAYERHGRPTCSECNDRLRKQRGCKKQGFDVSGQQAFRFTSPLLYEREEREKAKQGTHTIINECPVSYVLRHEPHVYEAINAHAYVENGALNPLTTPPWLRQAIGVVGSERERLRRLGEKKKQSSSDSNYGARTLRASRG